MPQMTGSGLDYIGVAKVIGAILLPMIGIGIVLLSLLAFARKLPLTEKTQRLKGFGLELEISVITFYVLIGLTLSLSGIYLITRDYETKLQDLANYRTKYERAEEDFGKALARARQIDVTALISLEGADREATLSPDSLECKLITHGEKPKRLRVEPGVKEGQYYVVIENLSPNTVIRMLQCDQRSSPRGWALEQFNPLAPEYTLPRQP